MQIVRWFSIAFVWLCSGTGLAQGVAIRDDDPALSDRAALLAQHLASHDDAPNLLPFASATVAGLGVAGLIALPLATESDFRTTELEILSYAAAAVWAAGGTASLLVAEPWRPGLLMSTIYFGGGAFVLGMAFENESAAGAAPVYSYIAMVAGGYLGTGALWLTSTLIRQPVPSSQLDRDFDRLRTPEMRRRLSAGQLAAIERRYRLSENVIPPEWMIAPMALSGLAVMLGAALDDSLDEDAKLAVVGLGVGQLWPAALALTSRGPYGYALYEDQLEAIGVELAIAPGPGLGGLALHGRF